MTCCNIQSLSGKELAAVFGVLAGVTGLSVGIMRKLFMGHTVKKAAERAVKMSKGLIKKPNMNKWRSGVRQQMKNTRKRIDKETGEIFE